MFLCAGIFDRPVCTAFAGRCKREVAESGGACIGYIWDMCMCILVSTCAIFVGRC